MTIIAVDCDEVLVESVRWLTAYVKDVYWHEWLYHDIKHYMLSKNAHIQLDQEWALAIFHEFLSSPLALESKPVEGARAALEMLVKKWYQLKVVTARNTDQEAFTHKQIESLFPWFFSDIYFAHHYTDRHVPKSQVCHDIGASILIEDNIDYALEASRQWIKTFLLEKPWNNWRQESDEKMIRVANWHILSTYFE
jgi:hypothetical protein